MDAAGAAAAELEAAAAAVLAGAVAISVAECIMDRTTVILVAAAGGTDLCTAAPDAWVAFWAWPLALFSLY